MARTLLQDMVEGTPFESLPANWSSFDLKSFSRQKQLWDYQQQAVASRYMRDCSQRNALVAEGVGPAMLSPEGQFD